jgi:hypothetical protein
MLATDGLDEFHIAWLVTVSVVPSASLAEALNCAVAPTLGAVPATVTADTDTVGVGVGVGVAGGSGVGDDGAVGELPQAIVENNTSTHQSFRMGRQL